MNNSDPKAHVKDAALQLGGYFFLNFATQNISERGQLVGVEPMITWPDFPYAPIGTRLVTFDISASAPGIIIYEFLPTREALELGAPGAGAYVAERYGLVAATRIAVTGLIQGGARAGAASAIEGINLIVDLKAAAPGGAF